MSKKITERSFHSATDGYKGWCTACKRFTRSNTEPDARGYDCPKCKGLTVMGAEEALMAGEIEFQ